MIGENPVAESGRSFEACRRDFLGSFFEGGYFVWVFFGFGNGELQSLASQSDKFLNNVFEASCGVGGVGRAVALVAYGVVSC